MVYLMARFLLVVREKKMNLMSVVRLEDVNGTPSVKIPELPTPLRVGDILALRFRLSRHTGGRDEVLDVEGQFRVTVIAGFDATVFPRRQLLSVESTTVPPKWRSIKKTPERRPLAPLRSPRTPI
jgi:hypothetical protein